MLVLICIAGSSQTWFISAQKRTLYTRTKMESLKLQYHVGYVTLAKRPVTRADKWWTEVDWPLMTPRKHKSPCWLAVKVRLREPLTSRHCFMDSRINCSISVQYAWKRNSYKQFRQKFYKKFCKITEIFLKICKITEIFYNVKITNVFLKLQISVKITEITILQKM